MEFLKARENTDITLRSAKPADIAVLYYSEITHDLADLKSNSACTNFEGNLGKEGSLQL